MKRELAFANSECQFIAHDVNVGVIRELQVVDAGHDRR